MTPRAATTIPARARPRSSDAGDEAQEDAVLGTPKKKKAPAPVAASNDDDSSAGGGGDDTKTASKSVEAVSAKASTEETSPGSTLPALEFGVGAKAMFRQLSWTSDARAAGLGPYNLTPGPETGAWLEFYPAAFGSQGFAANVGLFGRFDYGFGVATTLANGTDVATSFRDYLGGIKVRIPTGTFIPNVSVAYGQQVFEIAQTQNTTDLPKVAYQFIRPALGARVILSPTLAMDAAVAYLMVLDPGSGADHIRSSRFFPKATSYGIDAAVSVAVKLTGSIGARAGVDFRQYGIALHPDSNTRAVAGAVDCYIVAWAGLEVVLDGQGGAAGGDDEPVKPSKRRRRHAEPKPDDDESTQSSSTSRSPPTTSNLSAAACRAWRAGRIRASAGRHRAACAVFERHVRARTKPVHTPDTPACSGNSANARHERGGSNSRAAACLAPRGRADRQRRASVFKGASGTKRA